MATISASLVGTDSPQAVQIVVAGMVVGDTYEIFGTAGTYQWPVRAGIGTATATQVVRSDFTSPINTPVTYRAVVNGVQINATPITVPWAPGSGLSSGGRYLVSSLDGEIVVAMTKWLDNGDPRRHALRKEAFEIPGRGTPVVNWDVSAGTTRELVGTTDGAQTENMENLLFSGVPAIIRTDGKIRDLRPAQFVQFSNADDVLTGTASRRRWSLGFWEIDDPEPNTVVPVSTWDDFDLVYQSGTWSGSFDPEWAGQTWNLFDVEDWDSRA